MYLPVWSNGTETGSSDRDGDTRYTAIKDYLQAHPFPHEFTVLDFGANNGYFSRRLADDFDAMCTAADDCSELAPYPGVVTVHRRLEVEEISRHDVILAMAVLHHLNDWRDYLAAFLNAAPVVFLEITHPDEVLPKAVMQKQAKAIQRSVLAKKHNHQWLCETPGYDARFVRPLVVIDQR